jgi:hypothetical protein
LFRQKKRAVVFYIRGFNAIPFSVKVFYLDCLVDLLVLVKVDDCVLEKGRELLFEAAFCDFEINICRFELEFDSLKSCIVNQIATEMNAMKPLVSFNCASKRLKLCFRQLSCRQVQMGQLSIIFNEVQELLPSFLFSFTKRNKAEVKRSECLVSLQHSKDACYLSWTKLIASNV